MSSSINDKFVPLVYATFDMNRKHSFDVILEITKLVYFRVFSRDVTVAILATKEQRPCWCPQLILRESNLILLETFSFVLVEKHAH